MIVTEFHLDFGAGAIRTLAKVNFGSELKQRVFGGSRRTDEYLGECPHLAQLRVGFISPSSVAENWTAQLDLANGINGVGPIDLPFRINVEFPVTIRVTPSTAPTNAQKILLSLCDLPDGSNSHGATYLAEATDANLVLAIPTWAVALELLGSGLSGTFKNSAGTAVGIATGTNIVARPRVASTVTLSAAGFVLFHY